MLYQVYPQPCLHAQSLTEMVNEFGKVVRPYAIINDSTMTVGGERACEALVQRLYNRQSQFEFDKPHKKDGKAPKSLSKEGATGQEAVLNEQERMHPEPPPAKDRPHLIRPGLQKILQKVREIARDGTHMMPLQDRRPQNKFPPSLCFLTLVELSGPRRSSCLG